MDCTREYHPVHIRGRRRFRGHSHSHKNFDYYGMKDFQRHSHDCCAVNYEAHQRGVLIQTQHQLFLRLCDLTVISMTSIRYPSFLHHVLRQQKLVRSLSHMLNLNLDFRYCSKTGSSSLCSIKTKNADAHTSFGFLTEQDMSEPSEAVMWSCMSMPDESWPNFVMTETGIHRRRTLTRAVLQFSPTWTHRGQGYGH